MLASQSSARFGSSAGKWSPSIGGEPTCFVSPLRNLESCLQARFREETADDAKLSPHDRINRRYRRIELLAAYAEVISVALTKIEPKNGAEASAIVFFRREMDGLEWLKDPMAWRMTHKWSRLEMFGNYWTAAAATGGIMLEAVDNLIGAFGFDPAIFERSPHPAMVG